MHKTPFFNKGSSQLGHTIESADIVVQVADKTHSNMVDFLVETLSEIDHNDVTTDNTDEKSASNQDLIRKRAHTNMSKTATKIVQTLPNPR